MHLLPRHFRVVCVSCGNPGYRRKRLPGCHIPSLRRPRFSVSPRVDQPVDSSNRPPPAHSAVSASRPFSWRARGLLAEVRGAAVAVAAVVAATLCGPWLGRARLR